MFCDAERLLLGGNCNYGVYGRRGYGITYQLSVSFEGTLFHKGEQQPRDDLFTSFTETHTLFICAAKFITMVMDD